MPVAFLVQGFPEAFRAAVMDTHSPAGSGLEVAQVGDATVLRFHHRTLLGADLIDRLAAQMHRAVQDHGCRKLVLNFANVESMTTAMVGKIVLLKQTVENGGGRLALCGLDPFLLQIFKLYKLADVFAIHGDEPAALASL
jgi:anti-anti-sigma factor